MIANLLTFIAATALLAFTPGPDILYVMTRSITQGRAAGIMAALGMATGCLVHTALVAAGISLLIAQSPPGFMVIKILGAIYLCWLAITAFRAKQFDASQKTTPPQRLRRVYTQSVLMNILNPKVMLFFLSYLVGFTRRDLPFPLWLQLALLGLIFAAETVLCFGTAALLAGILTRKLRHAPRWALWLNRAAGLVFLALAAMIILQTSRPGP